MTEIAMKHRVIDLDAYRVSTHVLTGRGVRRIVGPGILSIEDEGPVSITVKKYLVPFKPWGEWDNG